MNLTAVLVGIGLLGIGALMHARISQQGLAISKAQVLEAERESLRRMLLQTVSCERSLSASTCTAAGQLVPLRRLDADGAQRTVVRSTGAPSRIGNFVLRAECTAGLDGIIVKAARLKNGRPLTSSIASDYHPDPITGNVVTFSDTASQLFDTGMELCSLGRTPVHTESSTTPLQGTACQGTYVGGWCSSYYYRDIAFAKPFQRPPAVIVSPARHNPLASSCPGHMDRYRVYATAITATGFRMVCSSSPNDMLCASSYTGWFLPSLCHYFAIER